MNDVTQILQLESAAVDRIDHQIETFLIAAVQQDQSVAGVDQVG